MNLLINPATITFLILYLLTGVASNSEDLISDHKDFEILKYNNPEAAADLGVGLWGWPMPMDFDNDGDLDLLVSCPDKPFNGTYFFENPTGDAFPIFKAPVRVADGDKNIQVSFVEGEPIVTKGSYTYDNFKEDLFANERRIYDADELEAKHQKIRFKQWKYVDYDADGDEDLIVGMDDWGDYGWDNAHDENGNWTNGAMHGYVYLIENVDGNLQYHGPILADGAPLDVYGAPSPNFDDFDGDGDLDIICGEFIDKLTWFENTGTRENPIYSKGQFLKNGSGIITMDLQMILPVSIDWDKDGDPDLLVGDEDGRVAFMENTGVVKDGMPLFANPRYFRQEPDNVKFGALVTPFSVDWDNDGDEDLICGNTAGYIGFIENLNGAATPTWASPIYLQAHGSPIRILSGEKGSIQGPCEDKWGYTTLSVADWDRDGLEDVIVNSIWGKVVWYKNIGSSHSPALDSARSILVDWGAAIPKPAWNWWNPGPKELVTQWRTTPYAIDWNKDGLMDLLMLDHEGYLAFWERYEDNGRLVLKPGARIFYGTNQCGFDSKNRIKNEGSGLLRLNTSEAGGSGRKKLCVTDWDGDGDLDLLVNSTNIALFENTSESDGKVYFTNRGDLSEDILAGHTTSPTMVDWDGDGKRQLLVGAEDGHFYLYNK